ncbi:hypothetical protein PF008_g25858 [Phytophthora fragariae]|uniref:Uncharacterized protein n=1 Tax=Phytophthora fragariae TaxID=53985 RepID=A0A6G0QJC5_9STRA|nr:hypothetical protein PF008_g25858 [Phytophthora fragariae]
MLVAPSAQQFPVAPLALQPPMASPTQRAPVAPPAQQFPVAPLALQPPMSSSAQLAPVAPPAQQFPVAPPVLQLPIFEQATEAASATMTLPWNQPAAPTLGFLSPGVTLVCGQYQDRSPHRVSVVSPSESPSQLILSAFGPVMNGAGALLRFTPCLSSRVSARILQHQQRGQWIAFLNNGSQLLRKPKTH